MNNDSVFMVTLGNDLAMSSQVGHQFSVGDVHLNVNISEGAAESVAFRQGLLFQTNLGTGTDRDRVGVLLQDEIDLRRRFQHVYLVQGQ